MEIAGRDEEGVREDNTLKAIMKRIDQFHAKTEPVIEYYRQKGVLHEIHGERNIEEIHAEILEKLNKK